MKKLSLGIIGMSEGNGHPYSWSAIFNSYDECLMEKCPFPIIPAYLKKQHFPNDTIKNANVTHIWTQDQSISEAIARTTFIPNICRNFEEMIGKVDAILLARDDAENHYEMAKPFISRGIPIYIDKPLAYTLDEAKKIYSQETIRGLIFSCSALLYSKDFELSDYQKNQIGKILSVESQVMKSWDKYAIHIIDPVLKIVQSEPVSFEVRKTSETTQVLGTCKNNINLKFTSYENKVVPIQIKVSGTRGAVTLQFEDTFNAFKSALQIFINIILKIQPPQPSVDVLRSIAIVEQGI